MREERPGSTRELPGFSVGEGKAMDRMHPLIAGRKSSVVSALIKTLRLGREEEAHYWTMALLAGKVSPWYVARRLFISAAEDTVCASALLKSAGLLAGDWKEGSDRFHAVVGAIANAPKWYDNPVGRAFMKTWIEVVDAKLKVEPSMDRFMYAVQAKDLRGALIHATALQEARVRHGEIIAGIRAALGDEGGSVLTRELLSVAARFSRELDHYNDTNWVSRMVLEATEGLLRSAYDWERFRARGRAVEKVVIADYAKGTLRPCPSWTQDGIHGGGHDRRFAGDWTGFKIMLQMFETYGRLDPADPMPGKPVKEWAPRIERVTDTIVMVSSRTTEGAFYMVDLAKLSCSCPKWVRTKQCHHLDAAVEQR